jgi:hypothetical protein
MPLQKQHPNRQPRTHTDQAPARPTTVLVLDAKDYIFTFVVFNPEPDITGEGR